MIKKFFLNFIKVNINNVNQRIDNYLFKIIKNLPKSKIYSLLRKGNIRVNKKRISYNYRLKINDIIRIPLVNIKKNNIYIDKYIIDKFRNYIIYEDKYMIAINKPYGISVHKGTKINLNIIDIFRCMYIKKNFLELVHRIDKDTSGILLISKNLCLLRYLHNNFKNNNIIKKYIALTYGIWPFNIKKIKNYIYKERYISYITKDLNKGKLSETLFNVNKYFNKYTLLDIIPITGRNHQIRLHTSSLGYPIIGDNIYGNKKKNNFFFKKFKVKRLFLHSYFLSFFHPFYKKKIKLYANLNNDFLLAINNLNKLLNN